MGTIIYNSNSYGSNYCKLPYDSHKNNDLSMGL